MWSFFNTYFKDPDEELEKEKEIQQYYWAGEGSFDIYRKKTKYYWAG